MDTVEFCNFCPNCPDAWEIFVKAKRYLSIYERPSCFISGGADSDVMLDIIYHADNDRKVRYVYFDTGLEMDATKRHIKYLEDKYGIEVETVRPKIPIPVAVKKYGLPVFNKITANRIDRLYRHGFDFHDAYHKDMDTLLSEYDNCKAAIRWYVNDFSGQNNINSCRYMKEFLCYDQPSICFSDKCCEYVKKNPGHEYNKHNNIDLQIIGVRRFEGGARSNAFDSCFDERTKEGYAYFRPLWWMTDKQRKQYETDAGIVHSDAYTVYGCKRTGCAGCPFGRYWKDELEMLKTYEPKLYKACMNIFGESYDYMNRFYEFREAMKEKEKS